MTDRQETAVRAPLGERPSAPVAPPPSGPPSGHTTGAPPATSKTPKPPKPPKAPKAPKQAKPAKPDAKAKEKPAPSAGRSPRRARLRLTRIDPWSVMKTAFLLSIAFAVVTVVSVFIIWSVLAAAGVWDSINQTVQDVVGDESSGWDVEKYVGISRVMGFTLLVSVVDVILITAIATLGAFLYNMSAALVGGVELTLSEDER